MRLLDLKLWTIIRTVTKLRQAHQLLLFLVLLMYCLLMCCADANGRDWFVDSQRGNDDTSGDSVTTAFATIGRAASVCAPGDHVVIREGTYRESVISNASGTVEKPIVFKAYQNENPVLSGCEPVLDWTRVKDSIWQATCDWNMGRNGRGNTLFVDGKLCFEATQGASKDRLNLSDWGQVNRRSLDSDGFFADDLKGWGDDFWKGAKVVHHVNDWTIRTSTVKDYVSETGQVIVDKSLGVVSEKHQIGYYLTGTRRALDAPGEWFKDEEAKRLYYCADRDQDPNELAIEFRRREHAFDLRDRQHVRLEGLTFRGASVRMNENTRHCQLSRLKLYGFDKGGLGRLNLAGSQITLRDSEVCQTWGSATYVSGKHHRIVNNYIHDIGYYGTSRVLSMSGSKHLVSHNTVRKFARSFLDGFPNRSEFAYNLFEDGARLSWDTGVFDGDGGMGSGGNCVIHHNVFRNTDSTGIYMAVYAGTELVFHHNLVYDLSPSTIRRKFPTFQKYYHNTFIGQPPHGDVDLSALAIESAYNNNLQLTTDRIASLGIQHRGNADYRKDDFVDFENRDFRLRKNSNAIDCGVLLPGINDDFSGKAPDAGAIEFGQTMWKVGHDFDEPPAAEFQWRAFPGTNHFENTTFNDPPDSWSKIGAPTWFGGNSWNLASAAFSFNGMQSIRLRPGEGIERTFAGLKPGGWYAVGANVRLIDQPGNLADAQRKSADFHIGQHRRERYVGGLQTNDWLCLDGLDFGTEGKYSHLEVLYTRPPGQRGQTPVTVDVFMDDPHGQQIGTLKFDNVIQDSWSASRVSIPPGLSGRQDLCFRASGQESHLLRLGDLRLLRKYPTPNKRVKVSVSSVDQDSQTTYMGEGDWFLRPETIWFKVDESSSTAAVKLFNQGEYDSYVDRFVLFEQSPPGLQIAATEIRETKAEPSAKLAENPEQVFDFDRQVDFHSVALKLSQPTKQALQYVVVSLWRDPPGRGATCVWSQEYRLQKNDQPGLQSLIISAKDYSEQWGNNLASVSARYLSIRKIHPQSGPNDWRLQAATAQEHDGADLVATDGIVKHGVSRLSVTFPQQINIGKVLLRPDRRSRHLPSRLTFSAWDNAPEDGGEKVWETDIDQLAWVTHRTPYQIRGDELSAGVRLASCIIRHVQVDSNAGTKLPIASMSLKSEHDVRPINNLARLGEAMQSSDHYFNRVFNDDQKRDYMLSRGGAAKAIDGIAFPDGNFTSTSRETNPWWQVDLKEPTRIDQIVLVNRSDAGERIGDFRVSVWDNHLGLGGRELWGKDYSYRLGDLPKGGKLTISGDADDGKNRLRDLERARLVRVQIEGSTLLAVSEVQIWDESSLHRINWDKSKFDYDFGRKNSPHRKTWTRITPDTFGDIEWDDQVASFDSPATGVNEINRDGIKSSHPATLRHKLPNGTWSVTLNMGSDSQQRGTMVWAEDTLVERNLNSSGGEFPYLRFNVAVSDGELNLRFANRKPDMPWTMTRMSLQRLLDSPTVDSTH